MRGCPLAGAPSGRRGAVSPSKAAFRIPHDRRQAQLHWQCESPRGPADARTVRAGPEASAACRWKVLFAGPGLLDSLATAGCWCHSSLSQGRPGPPRAAVRASFHWSPAAVSPRYLWERPGEKGLRCPRPPQIAGNSPTGRRPPY